MSRSIFPKEGGQSVARHPNKTTARETLPFFFFFFNIIFQNPSATACSTAWDECELHTFGDFFSLCRIGHDNKGGFAGWFLDKVMIDVPSLGQRSVFPCGRWLDKNKDDGQLERELLPGTDTEETYTPCKDAQRVVLLSRCDWLKHFTLPY